MKVERLACDYEVIPMNKFIFVDITEYRFDLR